MSELLPETEGEKYADRIIDEVEDEEELNEFGLRGCLEPYDILVDDQLTGDSK